MSGNWSKWVGHFERRFQREGGVADQPLWYQSSRVIALSCGIKISAVRRLVLSQWTRVTDRWTDGQNYDSQYRPRICSRDKNEKNRSLSHPFRAVRGNVRTPSMARWKVRGQHYVRRN